MVNKIIRGGLMALALAGAASIVGYEHFQGTNQERREESNVREYVVNQKDPVMNPSQVMAEKVREIVGSGHPLPNLYNDPEFQKYVNPNSNKGDKK